MGWEGTVSPTPHVPGVSALHLFVWATAEDVIFTEKGESSQEGHTMMRTSFGCRPQQAEGGWTATTEPPGSEEHDRKPWDGHGNRGIFWADTKTLQPPTPKPPPHHF